MISRFFEGGQHEDGLLHFSKTVSSDSEDFSATTHQVRQEGDVSPIDGHSVALHRVVDLGHDRLTSRLDAQHGGDLVRVVRRRFARFHA